MQVTTMRGGLKSTFMCLFKCFDWTEIAILNITDLANCMQGTKGLFISQLQNRWCKDAYLMSSSSFFSTKMGQ